MLAATKGICNNQSIPSPIGSRPMNSNDVERFFFRTIAPTALDWSELRALSNKEFRPPPLQSDRAPFHLDLESVLPVRTSAIRAAGQLVFHVVGDTGGVNGTGAQQNVADQMTRQIYESSLP